MPSLPQSGKKKAKKLKIIGQKELAVSIESSVYCDFCGTSDVIVFTSSFDDRIDGDNRKCETQICFSCVNQLYKKLPAAA
jgi:hypothetical protein